MKPSEKKARIEADLNMVNKNQRVRKDEPAARFKLVGGPWHGNTVRVYAPWDTLTFPDGSSYDIHAPLRKDGHWVYVNNMEETN